MAKKTKCKDCEDCRRGMLSKIAGGTIKVSVAAATYGTSYLAEKAYKALLAETCPECGHYMMHHKNFIKRLEAEQEKALKEQERIDRENQKKQEQLERQNQKKQEQLERQNQKKQEQLERQNQKELGKKLDQFRKQKDKISLEKAMETAERQISDLEKLRKGDNNEASVGLHSFDALRIVGEHLRQEIAEKEQAEYRNLSQFASNIRNMLNELDDEIIKLATAHKQEELEKDQLEPVATQIAIIEARLANLPKDIQARIKAYRKDMQARLKNYLEYVGQVAAWIRNTTLTVREMELLLVDKVEVMEDKLRQKGVLYLAPDRLLFVDSKDLTKPAWQINLPDIIGVEIGKKGFLGRSTMVQLQYRKNDNTKSMEIDSTGRVPNELWLEGLTTTLDGHHEDIAEAMFQTMFQ